MKKFVSTLALLALPACASITTGSSQSIAVDTTPVHGAQCTLSNDEGSWQVSSTPGSTTVHRSYSALGAVCTKPGYGRGSTTVESTTKGSAFGNIIFGGIIGGAVDMGNGSAYDYPSQITVPLVPGGGRKGKYKAEE